MPNSYANIMLLAALSLPAAAFAATKAASSPPPPAMPQLKPCASVSVDPPVHVTLGKSSVVPLKFRAARLVVGHSSSRAGRPADVTEQNDKNEPMVARPATTDSIADVQINLLSPTELFFLGRKAGSTNVFLQDAEGNCWVKDIIVTLDATTLKSKLAELMPEETDIKVNGAENALVLTGKVSDAVKLDEVMTLATSYGDGKKVVNMLRVSAPQQVMLEVKIAEVSKTLLDKFGLDYSRLVTSADGLTSSVISGIIGGGSAVLGRFHPNVPGSVITGNAIGVTSSESAAATARTTVATRGASLLGIEAEKKDGLVRVLAEPNIMAISGQPASFLSGGKIFIPVAQNNNNNGTTITLEEKEFGVGLKFTPTVLDGTRVNLKLVSEVSELSQTGSPFTTINGITAVLPSMTTRRADTTVQLGDGQSFAIAGLIRNNVTETISRFPGLGEIPILGALFRSTEFQNDQTELLFVVTPRLVKPIPNNVTLPTDNHIPPTRGDVLFMGQTEGMVKDAQPPATPEKK